MDLRIKTLSMICLAAYAGISMAQSAPQAQPVNRDVLADVSKIKGPKSTVYKDCVGAGRVAEGLRDNWRRQLEAAHKEIGFKYLRAHGLLHDELAVYNEDKQGNPRYNWQYIDEVYDYLLDIGMKPFVEVGFSPKLLASGDRTVFWWNAQVSTPKDYKKWDDLVTALVKHWVDRYGIEEVRSWRFEIWNEPQLQIFFQPPKGVKPMDAYFELYEHTAKAIASVDSKLVIGGPAGPGWFRETIQLSADKNLPLDFISYHPYGLAGGPTGLDETGENLLYLSNNMNAVAVGANRELPTIKNSPKPNLPIYVTEWSASYSSRDPVHDSFFSAPYILQQLRQTEQIGSMSYWTFTDVFEENGPGWRPFHGGFGLINQQGIKKSAYWAYAYLNQLGNTEIQSSNPMSYVCKDDNGGYQILFWDLTDPIHGRVQGQPSNQDFFNKPLVPKELEPAKIKLTNLPAGNYKLATHRIGYKMNDPYTPFLEMGRPMDVKRQDIAKLKELSSGKPISETTIKIDGEYNATLPMLENSVYYITLTPVK